jgi:hypothetical protein
LEVAIPHSGSEARTEVFEGNQVINTYQEGNQTIRAIRITNVKYGNPSKLTSYTVQIEKGNDEQGYECIGSYSAKLKD